MQDKGPAPGAGLCLRTSEPPVRAGRKLRSCWARLWASGDRDRSCHELFQRQSKHRPAPHSARTLASSSLRLIQKPQLFVQRGTKIHQQKQQGAFGFTKRRGGRETPVPTSCLWKEPLIPSWEHCPGAQGGLPSNPVSHQSPRPQG